MRWLLLALLFNPLMVAADGLVTDQINLHDLLGVSEDLDWDGDRSNERVLLLLSEDHTTVDMMTLVMDPLTGEVTSTEVKAAVLPATTPRLEYDLYSMGRSVEADGVERLLLWASTSKAGMEIVFDRVSDGWEITRASLNMRQGDLNCRIERADDDTYIERVLSDGEEIQKGSRPSMPPSWWQSGLARKCWEP